MLGRDEAYQRNDDTDGTSHHVSINEYIIFHAEANFSIFTFHF